MRSVSGITVDLHGNFFFFACKEEEEEEEEKEKKSTNLNREPRATRTGSFLRRLAR